jgi:hypothetical protein
MVSNSKLIAKGRRQKAEGFYVYYWYVVVLAVKSVLTFMVIAIKFITPEILGTLER